MSSCLTTVRRPLRHMGKIAAKTLLRRIACHHAEARAITIQTELVVLGATRPAPRQ